MAIKQVHNHACDLLTTLVPEDYWDGRKSQIITPLINIVLDKIQQENISKLMIKDEDEKKWYDCKNWRKKLYKRGTRRF